MIFNKNKQIEFNSKALLTLELILNELYQATLLETEDTYRTTFDVLSQTISSYKERLNCPTAFYKKETIKNALSDCNDIIKDLDKRKVFQPYQEQYNFAKQEFLAFMKKYRELS